MFWWSVAIAAACGLAGVAGAYYWDSSIGATVVLLSAGVFLVSMIVKRLL